MADDLSTTTLANVQEPIEVVAARIRSANESSPELREDVNRAVGLFLKEQPSGLESVDHSVELTDLLGSQWAVEIRAAQANYAEQRGQLCMDGAEIGKNAQADPVMMFNGQFVHPVTDVRLNGAGMDFAFVRTYKNQAYAVGPLGVNWDHNWNLWLREEDGTLVRSSGELREDRYRRHELYPYWVPPPGYHDTITEVGNSYVLRTPGAVRYMYERETGARHRIQRISDRNNNYLAFSYDVAGRLARVDVNSPVRWVAFDYDSADRVRAIRAYPVTYRDRSGKKRTVSRVWRYTYDDFGDLVAVTGPGAPRYPAGLTSRYEYSSPSWSGDLAHNLTRVWDAAGNLCLENEFGTQKGMLTYNRVVRQREGNGEYAFEYSDIQPETAWDDPWGYRIEERPVSRTIFVERNGHPVEHVYNRLGNLILRRETVVFGCDTRTLVSRYRYNRDGALVASLSPEGSAVQLFYGREDFYGRPLAPGDSAVDAWQDPNLSESERRAFGNQLGIVRRGRVFTEAMLDLSRGFYGDILPSIQASDPSDVIVKFGYEPVANQLATLSDPRHTASANPRDPESAAYRRHLTRYEYSSAPRANLIRVRYPDTAFPSPLVDGTAGLSGTTVEYVTYDPRGRLLLTRDEEGHATRRAYSASGPREGYLRTEIRDDGGLSLRTDYRVNEAGGVTARRNPRGIWTRTRLNELGQVVETTSGAGLVSRTSFDRNGQVTRQDRDNADEAGQASPDGAETHTFCYDGSGNLLRETVGGADLARHHVTAYRYDAANRRVETTLPRGNRVHAGYDERMFPRSRTRGTGSSAASTTRTDYDGDGRAVVTVDGRGNTTRREYDALGRVVAVVDALGGLRQFAYDKAGNQTVERFYSPRADGTHDLLSRVTCEYDERGSRVRSTVWAFPAPIRTADIHAAPEAEFVAAAAIGLVERVETLTFHDRARRPFRLLDPAGQEIVHDYDGADRRVQSTDALGNITRFAYDANGNVARVDRYEMLRDPTTGIKTGEEVFSDLSEYDAVDRRITATDGLGNRVTWTYDSRGNVASVTDPLGNVRRYLYDVFGRRTTSIAEMYTTGLGGDQHFADLITTCWHDQNGNLSGVRDARGNEVAFEYDELDRQHRTVRADGSDSRVEYDFDDHVVGRTDENGLRVTHRVDELGRVIRVDLDRAGLRPEYPYPTDAETFEACVFDGLGRTVEQRNDVCEIFIAYDSLGRPREEDVRFTAPTTLPGPVVLAREFDVASNRIRLLYPDGRDLRWDYDALHRLVRIEQRGAGSAYPGSAAWPAAYDVARYRYRGRRLAGADFSNAAGYGLAYDGGGRLISVRHTVAGAPLLDIQLLQDGAGNRRYQRHNPATPGAPNGEVYSYDSLYRLTRCERRPIASFNPTDFAPPAQPLPPNQLHGQQAISAVIGPLAQDPQQFTWRYDETGNRILERPDGQPAVTYLPNTLDQYGTVGSAAYSYDRNGNLLDDDVSLYQYNYHNRLSRVVDKATGGEVLYLRYDPVGRLTFVREAGVETHLVYDGPNVLDEYQGGLLTTQYINEDGPDRRVQAASGGQEWWYHLDVLRSTRLLTDSTGAVAARYDYDPFGQLVTPSVHPNRYMFAGKRLLTIGLYDSRARSYVPALGRFLQRDPAGMVDGSNLYPYSGNNPVTFVDPLGTDKSGTITFTEEENLLAGSLSLEERFALVTQQYDESLAGTSGESRRQVHNQYQRQLQELRREAFREGNVSTWKFAAVTYAAGTAGALGGMAGGAVGAGVAAELGLGTVGTSLLAGGLSGLSGAAATEDVHMLFGKKDASWQALVGGAVLGTASGALSSAWHYYEFPVESSFIRGQPGVIGPGKYGWQYVIDESAGVIGRPIGAKTEPDIPVVPGLHRAHYHGWFIGGGNKAFYASPRVNASYMKVFENAARLSLQGGQLEVTTMRGGGTMSLEWSAYSRTGQSMRLGIQDVRAGDLPTLAPTLRASNMRVTPGTTIWVGGD